MTIDEFKNMTPNKTVDADKAIEIFDEIETEHAFVQLPFTAIIDGRQYEGNKLSLMRAVVTGLAPRDANSIRKIATLKAPFNGFDFSVQVECLMVCVNESAGEYRLDFVEPTGPHLAHLRYLINAHLAGEIVTVGSLLGVEGGSSKAKKKAKPPVKHSMWRGLKKAGKLVFIACISVMLVVVVAGLIEQRLLVKKVPSLAQIGPQGTSIAAPESGEVLLFNAEAQYEQPLLAIKTRDGTLLTLSNPCDCELFVPAAIENGSHLQKGEAVAFISKEMGEPIVSVSLNDLLAKELLFGGTAFATMTDGRKLELITQSVKPLIDQSGTNGNLATFKVENGALSLRDSGALASIQIRVRLYTEFRKVLKILKEKTIDLLID